MLTSALLVVVSLCAVDTAPAIAHQDEAWRHIKIGRLDFQNISICELTAVLAEKGDVPIHLVCTSMVAPEISPFRLPEDATLGHAFDACRKSIPKLTVRRAGVGLMWNCFGDAPYAQALDRRLDAKAVSGTLDQVMNEVFGADYQVSSSFKLPNSRMNGDTLHVHLRSTGNTSRLDALVVAAENAEARIILLLKPTNDLAIDDVRPSLVCVAAGFTSDTKHKK